MNERERVGFIKYEHAVTNMHIKQKLTGLLSVFSHLLLREGVADLGYYVVLCRINAT